MSHVREPKGYAKKVAEGRRPFIYSDRYYEWKRTVTSRNEKGNK